MIIGKDYADSWLFKMNEKINLMTLMSQQEDFF